MINEFIEAIKEIERLQDRTRQKIEKLQKRLSKSKTLSKSERQTIKSLQGQLKSLKTKSTTFRVQLSRTKSRVAAAAKQTSIAFGDYKIKKEKARKRPHINTPFEGILTGKHEGTATAIWNTIKDNEDKEELIDIVMRYIAKYGADLVGSEWGDKYFDTVAGYDDKSDNAIYINDSSKGLDIIRMWGEDLIQREKAAERKRRRAEQFGIKLD